jgi:hypothetical protein
MFSSWDEAWINDPVKAMTRKLSGKPASDKKKLADDSEVKKFKEANKSPSDNLSKSDPRTDIYNFSSPSINLSELSINTTPYKKKFFKQNNFSDAFDTPDFTEREELGCASVTDHLRKCDRCYAQFKKMIDRKVNDKLHDVMLFSNFNRQSTSTTDTQSSDSWKETLIIVVGVVIVIFILYLITKSLNSETMPFLVHSGINK